MSNSTVARIVFGFALCSLALGILAGCAEEEAIVAPEVVRPVKVVELTGSGGAATRRYPGQVRAAQRVDLSFEVAGKLKELPVREGQLLEKGELVAALDDRDFNSSLLSAKAEFDNALANFRRGSKLVKDGFISRTDYDKLKSQRDVTSANLAKAEKAVNDTRLMAPFSGRVATRFVENFEDIQAKQPIISLQDIEELEILIDVPENRAIRMNRSGVLPDLHAVFDAFPDKRFELDLKEFSTEADPNTQSFRVVLSMPQPENIQLLPGMTAMVEVEDRAQQAAGGTDVVVTLPASAIFADEAGRSQVWVVDPNDNKVRRRPVVTGALTGTEGIRVESGLKAGEMVAVTAVTRLREGMEVRPVDKVEF